jgi:RimJ/RimL family protein N-acetyltransferase
MLMTWDQRSISRFLCPRIGMPMENMHGIASLDDKGGIIGAVGYSDWMDRSVQMHCAGSGNWLTREFLWAVFDYPFHVAGKDVVIGLVGSNNARALKLNQRLGFRIDGRIDGAHDDGALVVMSMRRNECRWIKTRKEHGQEKIEAAASA